MRKRIFIVSDRPISESIHKAFTPQMLRPGYLYKVKFEDKTCKMVYKVDVGDQDIHMLEKFKQLEPNVEILCTEEFRNKQKCGEL